MCGFKSSPGLGIESAGFFAALAVVAVAFPLASVFTVGSSAGSESVRRPVVAESSVDAVELPAAGVVLAGVVLAVVVFAGVGALCPEAWGVVCVGAVDVAAGVWAGVWAGIWAGVWAGIWAGVWAGVVELPGAVEAGVVVCA
jgi:hypothetical protein